eukprot:m.225827 g.225827  ORF g.225827 m.225827 type:complete len:1145 (-) comp26390_c0_seq9:52-3486(-)
MNVLAHQPRTVPGGLHPLNKAAIDWGWQGFIAYGSHASVVIVEPETFQVVQTLHHHKAPITKIKWERDLAAHNLHRPYGLRLVSGDSTGKLVVWDAISGHPLLQCSEGGKGKPGKQVQDLAWIVPSENKDASPRGYILSLHYPSPLILWSVDKGQPVWKVDFGDKLFSFALDPFCSSRMVVMTHHALLLVDDFSTEKVPSPLKQKYQIANEESSGKSESESFRALFSPVDEHQLFLVFPKEILIMDLEIKQTINAIGLERGMSPFVSVAPCTTTNMLHCLHANGCISARIRGSSLDSKYEFFGQSEPLRMSKSSRVSGMTLNPQAENSLAAICTDGTGLLYKFGRFSDSPFSRQRMSVDHLRKSSYLLTCCTSLAATPATCMAMSPSDQQARLAVGTASGNVQVFDMSVCTLWREYSVHTTAVRDLTWAGQDQIVSFSCDESGVGQYNNVVTLTDLRSGRGFILRERGTESTQLLAVRASTLNQYLLIALRNSPVEVYSLKQRTLLKKFSVTLPAVVDLCWSPSAVRRKTSPNSHKTDGLAEPHLSSEMKPMEQMTKEHLVVATMDGQILHFSVEGSVVRGGARIAAETGMAVLTTIAWKDDWLVTGDSSGGLHIWDLKQRVSRTITTAHPQIKHVAFASTRLSNLFLALCNGGVDVWDVRRGECVSSYKSHKGKDKEGLYSYTMPVAVAWMPSNRPILAMADGSLQIREATLQSCSSPIRGYSFHPHPASPYILEPKIALHVKAHLQHQPTQTYSVVPTSPEKKSSPGSQLTLPEKIYKALTRLPADFRDGLQDASTLAERCLLIAQFYGDEFETKFWKVLLFYLEVYAGETEPLEPIGTPTATQDVRRPQNIFDSLNLPPSPHKVSEQPLAQNELLPPSFGLVCHTKPLYDARIERLRIHGARTRRLSMDLKQNSTQQHVLLGQHNQAIQMLLETDAKQDSFYVDSLRACIIAAISSPSDCQNTIKLVAMNLIASGQLDQGVELLCLINNGLDACRYLQTYGHWEKAASLAKSTLRPREAAEIILRWVEHLSSVSVAKKSQALLLLLSLGQFRKALVLLQTMGRPDLAGIFAEICLSEKKISEEPSRGSSDMIKTGPNLLESTFMAYAKYLYAHLPSHFAFQRTGARSAALLPESTPAFASP